MKLRFYSISCSYLFYSIDIKSKTGPNHNFLPSFTWSLDWVPEIDLLFIFTAKLFPFFINFFDAPSDHI